MNDAPVMACLQSIADIASRLKTDANKKFFPVARPSIHDATLVAAPPKTSCSNGHSAGPIHRDVHFTSESGVYTFSVFLGKVTRHNGTIRLWKGSQKREIDLKNRKASISNLKPPELLTGDAGKVWLFDSRLLHQAAPNSSSNLRLNIVFAVHSTKWHGKLTATTFS